MRLTAYRTVHCQHRTAKQRNPPNPYSLGCSRAAAFNFSGFPVSHDNAESRLMLMHCNDANCAGGNETVTPVDDPPTADVGQYTTLALDSAGNPVIAYYDRINFNLKFTHCANPNCSTTSGAGALQFSSATYNTTEGTGPATITVTRNGGTTGAVGVSYSTSNGTATAGQDYAAASGTLSWANGEGGSKTFQVSITDDASVERGDRKPRGHLADGRRRAGFAGNCSSDDCR